MDDAISLGANCIAIIGSTAAVTSGDITQATYLARWQQVLDYLTAGGVYALPVGCDLGHWGAVSTLENATPVFSAWGALMDTYECVIGIDVTNEPLSRTTHTGWTADQIVTVQMSLSATLRAVTTKPITHSYVGNSVDTLSRPDDYAPLAVDADFISLHSYYAMSAEDYGVMRRRWWAEGRQFLLGEFGADLTLSTGDRAARYAAAKSVVDSDSAFMGAIAWAGYDTSPTPAAQFGLFDATRTARDDIADVFATFPTARA